MSKVDFKEKRNRGNKINNCNINLKKEKGNNEKHMNRCNRKWYVRGVYNWRGCKGLNEIKIED